MEDGLCEVRLTRGELSIATEPGDLVSLIPWQGDAHGIRTEGLYYPLHNETLHVAATRGISNLALGASVSLSVRSGTLLVIHYHQLRTEEGKFDE
jgi:thiamine pyrophosphokinase